MQSDARRALNAALRGTPLPPRRHQIPAGVQSAMKRSEAALASGDRDAIIAADDELTASINRISQSRDLSDALRSRLRGTRQ